MFPGSGKMIQKDETQMRLADSIKAVRAAVRLKHSIRADNDLNKVLPRVEREFYKRVQQGELPDAAAMLEVFGG